MAGAAKVIGAPLRLRRTEQVEELLQAIWEFRPELNRKNNITLILGLRAFLEDCQLKDLNSLAASVSNYPTNKNGAVTEPTPGVAIPVEASVQKGVVAEEALSVISDDVEW